jgi:hypothetical protein
LIGEDGRVYEGRGWDKVGAHTLGWNKISVSFAFMGNFEEKEAAPLAIDALKGIISYGVSQEYFTDESSRPVYRCISSNRILKNVNNIYHNYIMLFKTIYLGVTFYSIDIKWVHIH